MTVVVVVNFMFNLTGPRGTQIFARRYSGHVSDSISG